MVKGSLRTLREWKAGLVALARRDGIGTVVVRARADPRQSRQSSDRVQVTPDGLVSLRMTRSPAKRACGEACRQATGQTMSRNPWLSTLHLV